MGFGGKNGGKRGASSSRPVENNVFSLFFLKKKRGGGQMLYPRAFSGKTRKKERTGIKSCSEGELVGQKHVYATGEECGKDVSLG